MINLRIGKVAVDLDVVVKRSKRGTEYLQVGIGDAVLGNLFKNEKVTWTLKGITKQVSYRGDLFLQDTTKGIKVGEIHPETGLRVTEKTSLKTGEIYNELEGDISPEATKVFYKTQTGTLTISLSIKA